MNEKELEIKIRKVISDFEEYLGMSMTEYALIFGFENLNKISLNYDEINQKK